MGSFFDPRGALPSALIHQQSSYSIADFSPRSKKRHTGHSYHHYEQPRPKREVCNDWIFSSASNVHVAIDKSVFTTYVPFKSHVLTVADQRAIPVKGIGSVELRIRKQPGARESHTIKLENVLHVPHWLCNIFSDIHFGSMTEYDYTWTDFGVTFLKKDEAGSLRYWGFTENFCGLDKMVLSKRHRGGRSPMLEDKDREVFSVNLTWPQAQRDKWDAYNQGQQVDKEAKVARGLAQAARGLAQEAQQHEESVLKLKHAAGTAVSATAMQAPKQEKMRAVYGRGSGDSQRTGLSELTPNHHRRGFSRRFSGLKAPAGSIANVTKDRRETRTD